MNESQSPPESGKPESSVSPVPQVSVAPTPFMLPDNSGLKQRLRLVSAVVAVLVVALGAQWWVSHTEIRNLREEVARRLQSGRFRQ